MMPKGRIESDRYELWMTFSAMRRIGEHEEIAPAIVCLASEASTFLTASNLVIDGGFTC
jgi:NAD(P)-dependent dehydrogenase (short-subunit alcohol dehydrogenase family)